MARQLPFLADRLRIALVSPYDHQVPGGVREHVVNLDQQLRELGHDTLILAPASTATGLAENVRCVSDRIVSLKISGSVARITLSLGAFLRIRHLLAAQRFDVIHLHEPLIPTVSLFALLSARCATVGTIHGYRDTSPLYRFGRPVLDRLMRRLDRRTAVSSDALRWASQYFPGDYRIISDGVDVQRFSDRSLQPLDGLRDGTLNVLFVGRLEPRKGLGYLLEALKLVGARVRNVRLIVAGAYSPSDRGRWESAAQRSGNVVFLGPVSAELLPRLYRSAHLFCAPSTGFEALGIVLLEAMASGLPIVTTDIEGYRTVVTHGAEGFLVPPRDPRALAEAIGSLLVDPARRRSMAVVGAATVQRYDWSLLARRYLDVYAEAVDHFAGRAALRRQS